MKKLLGIAALVCALSLTVSAAEGKKQLTDEQKKTKQELLAKYDTNKDGKIDKDEKAKMSKDDLAKAEDVGLVHKHKEKSSDSK